MTTAEPSDRLFLVGTVHRDPHGEERLGHLLENLRPALVTIEMSPFACQYRSHQSHVQLLRLERILERLAGELDCPAAQLAAHPAIAEIRDLLALPFEYRAARNWADTSGAALTLVDLSEVSAPKLRRVERNLISYRNISVLIRQPTEAHNLSAEGYATARQLLAEQAPAGLRHSFLAGKRGKEGIGPRDEAMANKIGSLLERWPKRRLVHIGGWVHLVDDPQGQTLYSRLTAWRPRRLLLDNA